MKTSVNGLPLFIALIGSLTNMYTLAATDDIDISGYFMLDYDSFDEGLLEDTDNSTKQIDIRRARIGFKTTWQGDWRAKLKVDFAQGDAEVKDAYIQYRGWQYADIKIGRQKEPFGLERLSSPRNLLMIERSVTSQALAPGRSIGIQLEDDLSWMNWHLGYFAPDETESSLAITGRAAWLPWKKEDNLLHFGLAMSKRSLNGSEFRFNEQLEVYSADSLFEGEKLNADTIDLHGVEFLWQFNGITAMAEYQLAEIKDINELTYDYQGGYIQLGYQLSGDNRKYKNGKLGGIQTAGWELTTRFSQFNMEEEDNQSEIYSLGVNYYANKKLKLMTNFIKSEQSENGDKQEANNAISFRVQYTF